VACWVPAPPSTPKARTRPQLGVTYMGHDPTLLEAMVPLVDYIETTPDSIAEITGSGIRLHRATLAELKGVGDSVRLVAHGIGLSLGSASGYSTRYLGLLDELLDHVPIVWHSEHLGYTTVNGENLGTMLAMPRSQEALSLVCERIHMLQERYRLPFLLENIIRMLPDYPEEYSEAGFLNAITRATGCGLLLDVYNLECDAHNLGFDVDAFLAELDLSHVREVHVACGTEFRGFLLDAHSRVTRASTIELAARVVASTGGAVEVVTYEFLREAVPLLGHVAIVRELERLRAALCA
jgi:uncharacterized protein (UPF0276 family)